MKKTILLLLLPCYLFSQEAKEQKKPSTKIEELSNKEGSIIKKEFYDYGSIRGLHIEYLVINDVSKTSVVKGVKLSMSGTGSSYSRDYSSFLDADEIAGLIKFLEFIQTLNNPVEVYTEYQYASRGDFKAYAYRGLSDKVWSTGAYADKYYSNSSASFKANDAATLKDDLEKILIKMGDK